MRFAILTFAVLALWPFSVDAADEVGAFRLTDIRAFLEYRYRNSGTTNEATGFTTDVDDTRHQIELGATTTSYVYHPKLLRMLITGSLLSDRQRVDREQVTLFPSTIDMSQRRRDEVFLNVDAMLQFLKDKPYPTTLSYLRDNPIVKTGVEGSFTQESERIGLDFQLLDVLPVDLSVNGYRDSSFGESLDRIIDFSSDRFSVEAKKSYSAGNRFSLDYEIFDQTSRNGDPRRTIQETIRRSQRLALKTNSRLGDNDELRIDHTTSINQRDNPDVTDVNFTPEVRWIHSSALQSRFRYSFNESERPESDFESRMEMASASLQFAPSETINGFIRADADRSEEKNRLSQDGWGLSGRANFERRTAIGQLDLSLGLGYLRNDRVSQVPRISIFDEPVTLIGAAPVNLLRDFVIASTVVVRNDTRTQVYIEGIDYLLREIGSQTQIERLLGGSILDGETVLVDYEADTGGTFEYSQSNQALSGNFRFARYHTVFFRYRNNEQELESGLSTLPFNSVEALEVGIREQIPLRWGGIQLNGEARFLRQEEDINPFDQKSVKISVQAPLPLRLVFNATASRNIVENLLSDEDVDLTVYSAFLTWRARRNLTIRADAYRDEDTGGTVLRRNGRYKLGAQWRFRRIFLRLDARYEQQQQGTLNNEFYEIWLQIRRELF